MPSNQHGFTLIEVLIALALMALLSIISWQALDVVQRSSERLNASTHDTLALARVLGQLEQDISQHATAGILPQSAQTHPPVTDPSSPDVPDSSLLPPGIHWSSPVLTILRSAHDGKWQQVIWGQLGQTLQRAVGPASHTLPLPPAQASQEVLQQIKSFSVRAWIPGQGWTAPDTTISQLAATGLEITIVREHRQQTETYRKVVLLP
ncbi:PulJ/GspJ family protein [Pollutimonas harenae]|uniref:Prepilin-type N-terminal cleavage/methylation domain-containing protein n=1 Tax=Pollutimonas harenae TaxID=657015 RepID=A0A853H1X1_9BURK|nr:prepilin-type N-terminal cleavage/methylation domain-containing protein [Pollutimonas harenae]NYT86010.1 prepilin-type N-terminal cleavage/methylation domain-containing protein [Pollutimonas harenae]